MLSKKEFDVLTSVIEQEGAPQRAISEETGYSIGTINKVVKELSEKGLYNGKTITEKGLAALEPYRVKRAIFLAAGFGSRLVPITLNTPKPLVRVHGKRIIETLLDAVVKAEIPEIILVRGYLGEQFEQLLHIYPQIKFVDNELYNESNNISSAYCVRDWQLFSGEFHPQKPIGKGFHTAEIANNDKIIEYLRLQKGKVICLNDTEAEIMFEAHKKLILDAFEKLLPEKSSFEL